jgi:ABC-type phosphate transport system permease subunit
MDLAEWLRQVSQDADAARDGFQAQPMYVVLNIVVPAAYGAIVAGVLTAVERLRGRARGEGAE